MKRAITLILILALTLPLLAQTALKNVYDESLNPLEQTEGKFVVCQVGGNWCPWCLRFADFAAKDTAVSKVIDDNFVLIHVNYNPRKSEGEAKAQQAAQMMKRLGNPSRFGYPVFVVLDHEGKVIHTQDSSFLEEGQGYSQEKVLRFFKCWTPSAVKQD